MKKNHYSLKLLLVFFIFLLNLEFAKADNFKKDSQEKTQQQALIYSNFNEEEDEDFAIFESQSNEIYDPLEKMNRKIYVFNDYFDRYFFEHIARLYRLGLPKQARTATHNFLTNIYLPISSFNSLLQGKVNNSLATFSHFLINSTIGIGGLMNVAGDKGIRYKSEDFGQTLGYYGVNSGAYLVVPFLGPSSTRDFSGWLVERSINFTDLNLLEIGQKRDVLSDEIRLVISATWAVDKRESLIDIIYDIRKESFDPYATIRSAYLQKRESDIKF